MNPYKRKRRSGGSMVVLGGWLFADLLLGVAMLFAVATTVGAPPPTPTPTAAPNYLATSQAQLASQQNESSATVSALQNQIAENDTTVQAQQNTIDSQQQTQEAVIKNQDAVNARATEAANDEATRNALSASDRATQDAQSTQQAVESQATISAFATQQAEAANSNGDLNNQLATTEAQATQQAASGVDTQGTIASLQGQIASNNNSLSTSQAQANSYQATSEALTQQQGNVQATISAAQQQAAENSLNPNSQTVTISVDRAGVVGGNSSAVADAKQQLDGVLKPYLEGQSCIIGFALISSNSPGSDIGPAIALSNAIGALIAKDYPQLLGPGSSGQLPYQAIALPGESSDGGVEIQIFINQGCKPAS